MKFKATLGRYIINIILLVMFFCGIYFLSNNFYQSYQEHQDTQQSKKITSKVITKNKTQWPKNNHNKMPKQGDITVHWNALHKINPRIKAWLYIPGTNINYLVMQGTDNSFYLTHDERNQYLISGQIFLDYRNSPNISDFNTFIYGHWMPDGTRFADLNYYFNKNYFNKHRNVYLYTPHKRFKGKVFAVQSNSGLSNAHTMSFNKQSDKKKYINYMKKHSVVNAHMETNIHKILTLWTCTMTTATDDYGQPIPADKARTFVSVSLKEVK